MCIGETMGQAKNVNVHTKALAMGWFSNAFINNLD